MKKRLIMLMLGGVLSLSLLTACGGNNSNSEPAPTPAEEQSEETNEVEEELTEDVVSSNEEFSILDVDETMINAAYYALSEDGSEEVVFSLFTGPDGGNYVSVIAVAADGSQGAVFCGDYTNGAKTAADENGIVWSYLSFVDMYTGENMEVAVGEAADGSAALISPDGTIFECEELSSSDAINYMGVAVAFIP